MDHLYQVSGCSMMPTLADGDVIEIVDRRWQDGDIVVARVGSKTVVKRVVGDKLVGDNNISTKFNIFDVVILGKIKKIHCLPSSYLLQSAEATYEKLRVIGLDSNNVWKVYDVDINTGAKTLVSGFTDFSAFNGNRPTGFGEADKYVYFTSTMSYIGNGKLRVITNDNNNTWKAYDVDVNTGAKTLVSGFTDFSAFNSNRPTVGSERDSYVYFTSTMSYIGNGKLRVITNDNNNTWKAYDVDVNTGAKTLVSGFTDFSAFNSNRPTVGSERDSYVYFTSTMSYIGNGKLRVITNDNNNTWKAYDVDVNTGAKTLVSGFTDFSAFNSNRPTVGSERDNYVYFTSAMTQLNSMPQMILTFPTTNQSFSTVYERKIITLSGTVSDVDNDNVTVSATIGGKTKGTVISGTSTEKSWSLTWDVAADNISQGSYSNIVVTADDGNGGVATTTMGYTLTVDRTVPVISLSGVANGQTYQNSVSPTFSATDAGGSGLASVTATLNGLAYTSGTTITSGGSKTLVVTAVDKAGNQAQQTVNFTVNKAPFMVLFSPAANQTLAEGQAVSVAEDRFTLRVTPGDADTGDTLQYKMIQGEVTKVDWTACTGGTAFEYTFAGLLLGNNVCQVLVKDNKGGQAVRTFTLRNKASGSSSAALSQKGVREVLAALGYPGTDFGCLNDLKPGGYSGPLSLSGILNQVE